MFLQSIAVVLLHLSPPSNVILTRIQFNISLTQCGRMQRQAQDDEPLKILRGRHRGLDL